MTDERDALLNQLESLIKGAQEFKAKHGSCRVTVGPNAPVAKAQIQQVAGFWIDVENVTLVSRDRSERTVIDGPLVYYRDAEHEGVTARDVVKSIDWLGSSDEIEFSSADWSSVDDDGQIHLEGRKDGLLVDATFVLREFIVQPDWDAGLGCEDDDDE